VAFLSGNGGAAVVGIVEHAIKQWTLNSGSRSTENTHSGTAGFTNYEHVAYDARWTADGPWDDAKITDIVASGIIPGTKITLILQIGSGSKTYTLAGTLVEDFEVIVDNTSDIVRWRATGKGGTITRPV